MSITSKKTSALLSLAFITLGMLAFCCSASAQTASQDCEKFSGDQAIAACDRAIQQNPRDANAFYNRGLAWESKNDLAQALTDFRNYARLTPNDPRGPRAIQRIEGKIDAKKK